jgi:hypothetical protein
VLILCPRRGRRKKLEKMRKNDGRSEGREEE